MTKAFPDAELFHVYDPALPRIGIGEGTTPRFPRWLDEVGGLGLEDLREPCRATLKLGTHFEGWGPKGRPYINRFQPVSSIGFHFDTSLVIEVLRDLIKAEHIDAQVTDMRGGNEGARIEVADGRTLEFDYLLNATGFPRDPKVDLVEFDWVPTNAARLCRRSFPSTGNNTRAIARRHGWIFAIPLQSETSFGYVHNSDLTPIEEVDEDFERFLAEEGLRAGIEGRQLPFPNFARREMFDGAIFHIGNATGFIEPLEATAIGSIVVQVRRAARWISEGPDRRNAKAWELSRESFNRGMLSLLCRNSLFLTWHYAAGSAHDTPFWRHAAGSMERAFADPDAAEHREEFETYVQSASAIDVHGIADDRSHERWVEDVLPRMRIYKPFGNFSELNFAQVGHGMGYYSEDDQPDSRL